MAVSERKHVNEGKGSPISVFKKRVNMVRSALSEHGTGMKAYPHDCGPGLSCPREMSTSVLHSRLQTSEAPYHIDINLGMTKWSRTYRETRRRGESSPKSQYFCFSKKGV